MRLGCGGSFCDRTLASFGPRRATIGLAFARGVVPWLKPEPHDVLLDSVLSDSGLVWPPST